MKDVFNLIALIAEFFETDPGCLKMSREGSTDAARWDRAVNMVCTENAGVYMGPDFARRSWACYVKMSLCD